MTKSTNLAEELNLDLQASMDRIDRVGRERIRTFQLVQKHSQRTIEENLAQLQFFDRLKSQDYERPKRN